MVISSNKEFRDELLDLTTYHYHRCDTYKSIIHILYPRFVGNETLESLPFLPVRFFKHFLLTSVPKSEIFKVMKSSGTSGAKSQIVLDKNTARDLNRALVETAQPFLGKKRRAMLVFDSDRNDSLMDFDARMAGVRGFSMFSRRLHYLLNSNGEIDGAELEKAVQENDGMAVTLFGFTSMVWSVLDMLANKGLKLKLAAGSCLTHGGGWKKLEVLNVSKAEFENKIKSVLGSEVIIKNYYGLIEQTGSIFFECNQGFFHNSHKNRFLVRDANTLELVGCGEAGYLQLMSLLPKSYPGHNILTEDLAQLRLSRCECGNPFPAFKVLGRAKRAEPRGCSDVG